jgi:hypothetical protein
VGQAILLAALPGAIGFASNSLLALLARRFPVWRRP